MARWLSWPTRSGIRPSGQAGVKGREQFQAELKPGRNHVSDQAQRSIRIGLRFENAAKFIMREP
jgi:hypothetical protein